MTRCLITAGPTREHIDPVRFLSNGSSGRMGYALATAAAARGWSVDLVSGPVAPHVSASVLAGVSASADADAGVSAGASVSVRRVVSADEMFAACEPLFARCDVFIAVAAVCDYKPRSVSAEKIKKAGACATGSITGRGGLQTARRDEVTPPLPLRVQTAFDGEARCASSGGLETAAPCASVSGMTLDLVPTVDILKTLAARKTPRQCVVGFAAETRDVESYARQKLVEKNLDWIVANDVSKPGIGMDAADNAIVMLSRSGARAEFGPAPKEKVAEFILARIA